MWPEKYEVWDFQEIITKVHIKHDIRVERLKKYSLVKCTLTICLSQLWKISFYSLLLLQQITELLLSCFMMVRTLFCSSSLLHQQQLWELIRFVCGCLFSAFFLYDGCVLTELTATFNFLMCTLFVINYMNETDTLVWRNMNKWYDIYCWTRISDISSQLN